jgi:hypothetical protein
MADHGKTIAELQERIRQLNMQVDALGRVWCSGGCTGGMRRHQGEPPTAAEVVFLVRNALRAVEWYVNAAGKMDRETGESRPVLWEQAKERLRAAWEGLRG